MGKETAKIGQGKAFKEGWIKKDGGTLKLNVSRLFSVLSYAKHLRWTQSPITVKSNYC